MPSCDVRRYQDVDGHVPFDVWLRTMTGPGKAQNLAAAMKIAAALQRLATEGHALRRPLAAPLRNVLGLPARPHSASRIVAHIHVPEEHDGTAKDAEASAQ